jgi:hypothetical protein
MNGTSLTRKTHVPFLAMLSSLGLILVTLTSYGSQGASAEPIDEQPPVIKAFDMGRT